MKNRRIRVLHVVHDMGVGGTEQVVRQIVLDADPARFRSAVACIDGRVGPIGVALSERGVTVHRLERGPGLDRALIGRLRRLIRDERVDVLHCHQYTPWTYGVLAAAFTGVRVVFTEHGRFHPDRYTWKRRLLNPLLARLTDEIVSISAATREALVVYEWLPRRRIRVIYNGVTPPVPPDEGAVPVRERLEIEADAIVLGTIARFDPIKNQAMMLEALERLRRAGRRCVLILAGDGPEREALERQVAELALEGSVFFTGFVTDIAAHLDAIDVFLLTSWSEGTSVTLLEAMSSGKAIVATSVGGSVEVLDGGRTAMFVPPGDVSALTETLERLLEDDSLRARLGDAARSDFTERFEPRRMVSAYEALYAPDDGRRTAGIASTE